MCLQDGEIELIIIKKKIYYYTASLNCKGGEGGRGRGEGGGGKGWGERLGSVLVVYQKQAPYIYSERCGTFLHRCYRWSVRRLEIGGWDFCINHRRTFINASAASPPPPPPWANIFSHRETAI